MNVTSTWQLWAVLSAVFAALTAIFAKVGVENVNADFATFIRTVVILVTLAFILLATGTISVAWRDLFTQLFVSVVVGAGNRCVVGLLFPCSEDRRRSQGRAHRQALCRVGGTIRRCVSRRALDRAELARSGADCCRRNSGRLSLIAAPS